MSQTQLDLSVIMERKALVNKWVQFQWEAVGVVPARRCNAGPRQIHTDARSAQWLFPPLPLNLYPDEAENYLLNTTAPEPKVFVMWRGVDLASGGLPEPVILTVSYGEAARMMDSGEQVDGVPMPVDIKAWTEGFARHHYRSPERAKSRRYATQKTDGDFR